MILNEFKQGYKGFISRTCQGAWARVSETKKKVGWGGGGADDRRVTRCCEPRPPVTRGADRSARGGRTRLHEASPLGERHKERARARGMIPATPTVQGRGSRCGCANVLDRGSEYAEPE